MILVIPKPDAAEESSSQPAYPITPLFPPPLLDLGLSRKGVVHITEGLVSRVCERDNAE
jgi:hypothetical protein